MIVAFHQTKILEDDARGFNINQANYACFSRSLLGAGLVAKFRAIGKSTQS
jgi:hypothetical protein